MDTDGIVIGVYLTANAWAARKYDRGHLTEERLEPKNAFRRSSSSTPSLQGDASVIAKAYLAENAWPYGLIDFRQMAKGEIPWQVANGKLVALDLRA